MIKPIIHNNPHKEEDIITNKPIRFSLGFVDLDMDILSFKDFCRFERGIKAFSFEHVFSVLTSVSANEIAELTQYDEIYSLIEPELGLPYFLMGFCKPVIPAKATEVLETWLKENFIALPASQCSPVYLRLALANLFFHEVTILAAFEFLASLIAVQSTIKKKAVERFLAPIESVMEPPRSPSSRKRWESIQRKLLQERLISSS